ncbi:MAG: ABC transporter permease [Propioniciclava sp.]
MRTVDVVGGAVANTFRSKARTTLTVLAIFVGAFTLTTTSALGAGINTFLSDTIGNFGASDVLNVNKPRDFGGPPGSGTQSDEPQVYDPTAVDTAGGSAAVTDSYMNADDFDTIASIDGVLSVEPDRTLGIDSIAVDGGTEYAISATQLIPGQELQLAAGTNPVYAAWQPQAALPVSFVDALGFESAEEAAGSIVTISLTDALGDTREVDVTITGVSEGSLSLGSSANALTVNEALALELETLAQTGLSDDLRGLYSNAFVMFDAAATDDEIAAIQEALTEAGFESSTLQQQLGVITAVIDGIVFVLNAFAVIALIAAAFGIINTLYMSVQERTREIGLMKAMGMGSGRVFSMFSLEAVFIGLLGSAIGVVIAMLAATALNGTLAEAILADLAGLQLFAFEPITVLVTIVAIMLIAFLAGTLPAIRAARQDPVTSLRYE